MTGRSRSPFATLTVRMVREPRRIRWPFARRRTVDQLEATVHELRATLTARDRALARLGHDRDRAWKDAEQLVRDLRVVRLHIDYGHSLDVRVGRVRFSFELDEIVFDSFRRHTGFREVLAWMIERSMLESPAGRAFLAGPRTRRFDRGGWLPPGSDPDLEQKESP